MYNKIKKKIKLKKITTTGKVTTHITRILVADEDLHYSCQTLSNVVIKCFRKATFNYYGKSQKFGRDVQHQQT